MKKIFKPICLFLLLLNFALSVNSLVANAADTTTLKCTDPKVAGTPRCLLEAVGKGTGLPSFNTMQHPDAPADAVDKGLGVITSPIYYALDLFRFITSSIAVIVIIIAAIKLVSRSADEEAEKVKHTLQYGIMGLLLINLSSVIVKKMFFGETGEAFSDTVSAQMFAEEATNQIRGVIGFIQVFLGAAAVLVIVIRGFTVITSAGNEEALTKAKHHILYAVAGLLIIGISEYVVTQFAFPEHGTKMPILQEGWRVLAMLANFVSGFIAIAAFVMLFYAGYKYVIAVGKEEETEKAKKIIFGAVIALLLGAGSYAAINTFVKINEPPADQETTTQAP